MNYGFIILNENMSKNGIKYEFGKRYKGNIKYSSYFKVDSTDDEKLKYIEIEIFDGNIKNMATDFRIIKEVNYIDFYKPKFKSFPFLPYILAIKCKDKEALEMLFPVITEKNADAVISSNVDSYINLLLNTDAYNFNALAKIIKKYGRNKLLDKVRTSGITLLNAKIETAKIGRPQDLDILLDDSNNLVVGKVLENGRFKDINNYFNKHILVRRNFDANIIKTGIDKYLDEYIHYTGEQILMEVAEIGRKKDLNILIKSKSERIRSIVASHGYDEHLDMLVNDKSKMVLQSVLNIGRDKDIDILRKSTYAKELNFPKK
jgi:hypothetical protein